jgi:outer membrane protein OmpA-like peptidoglycan-associated protein
MTLPEESRQSGAQGSGSKARGPSRRKIALFIVLILVLLAIPTYFFWNRLTQMSQQVSRLSQQVEQTNTQLGTVAEKSDSALVRASQAEQSALEAARQRDQAEKAKAASQKQAEQAITQAQAAQQQAAAAQAKAEEYRKEREAELARLQQVLGQIADTRRTSMGLVMTLGSKSIRFAFDESSLRPEDKEVLSRIAGVLSTLKGYQIYVYGYTDDIGTKEYNLKLSDRRAKAVRDYLVANGLDPNIMTTKGYGKADPLVPGSSPQARAINRRVEIGLVDSTIKPLDIQNQ